MSDKLVRYESLSTLIAALNDQIALSGQQTALALAAAGSANNAAASVAAQTAITIQKTADAVGATTNAVNATANANAATAAANGATTASQLATQAAYNARDTALAQAAYAKAQGDYAKAQGQQLGNMSASVYDPNNNGVVDNAERLGGVGPGGYVRSASGDQSRVISFDGRSIYPTNLSSTQGFGRFRFGTMTDSGSGIYADVIDLSTYGDTSGGGVNALYFRKDQGRIVHKFGPWGATTWSSERQLAYLDEVGSATDSFSRTGSVAMTGPLQAPRGVFTSDSGAQDQALYSRAQVQLVGTNTSAASISFLNLGNDAVALKYKGGNELYLQYVGESRLWHSGNFTPDAKANVANPAFTGNASVAGNITLGGGQGALNIDASNLTVNAFGGRSILLNSASGRVGINTLTAQYTLDVSGDIRASGSVLTGTVKTDSPLALTTLAGAAQGLNAAKVQVGPSYNALLDPGDSGISARGDLLVGGNTRLTTSPVYEGSNTRATVGLYREPSGAHGFPLYPDSGFRNGLNGVVAYNNVTPSGAVLIERLQNGASTGSRSSWMFRVTFDPAKGGVSPGVGGFFQSVPSRTNATFVHRVRARFPVGYTLNAASNVIGTGSAIRALTPMTGTGKWEDYAFLIQCGEGGTFSSFGFLFLTGPAAKMEWYVEDACVYDVTSTGLNELLSSGGDFSGPVGMSSLNAQAVRVSSLLGLPGTGTNSFTAGTGDGATYSTYNTRLHLHYGLGIEDVTGNVKGLYDARAGRWTVQGGYTIDDGVGYVRLSKTGAQTLLVSTASGTTAIGSENPAYSHFVTDRPSFYFNAPLAVNGQIGVYGSSTYLEGGAGYIAGQPIVTGNDARLQNWGLYGTNGGQDFLGRGGRVIVATGTGNTRDTLILNYAGDFPNGTVIQGSGLTVGGTLGIVGLANFQGGATLSLGSNLTLQANAATPNDPGDIAFLTSGGAELARVFVNPAAPQLILRAAGNPGLVIDGSANYFQRPVVTTLNAGAADSGMYARANVQAAAPQGGTPAVSWLQTGIYGLSMYLHPGENRLRLRDSGASDYLLLTTKDVEETQVTGLRSTNTSNQDANTIRPAGAYHGSTMANMPLADTWYYLTQNAHEDPNYAFQTAAHYFSEDYFLRRKDAGLWQPWRRVWHAGNFDPATKASLTGATFSGAVTATDFLKSSSRALKTDILPYTEDAVAEVGKLSIVTYTYRADQDSKPQVGIIADDTANTLVSGVQHDTFDTANALAIALRAIQQLSERVDYLERQSRKD